MGAQVIWAQVVLVQAVTIELPHKRAVLRPLDESMAPGDISRRDRQVLKAEAAAAAAAEREEAASWVDTDSKLHARQERQAAQKAKADAKLAARQERRALEEAEVAAQSSQRSSKNSTQGTKITQAELARRQALLAATSKVSCKSSCKSQVVPQPKLEANLN